MAYNAARVPVGVGTLILTGRLVEQFKTDVAATLAANSLLSAGLC